MLQTIEERETKRKEITHVHPVKINRLYGTKYTKDENTLDQYSPHEYISYVLSVQAFDLNN